MDFRHGLPQPCQHRSPSERTWLTLERFNQRGPPPTCSGPGNVRHAGRYPAEDRPADRRLAGRDRAHTEYRLRDQHGRPRPAAPARRCRPGERPSFPPTSTPGCAWATGVVMELVPTTAEGWPTRLGLLERLRDPRVRVLAVSLVQFSSYLVDPERLRRHPGDRRDLGGRHPGCGTAAGGPLAGRGGRARVRCPEVAASPWGSGFVYVRRELIGPRSRDHRLARFEGTDDLSRLTSYDDTLRADARRFER